MNKFQDAGAIIVLILLVIVTQIVIAPLTEVSLTAGGLLCNGNISNVVISNKTNSSSNLGCQYYARGNSPITTLLDIFSVILLFAALALILDLFSIVELAPPGNAGGAGPSW